MFPFNKGKYFFVTTEMDKFNFSRAVGESISMNHHNNNPSYCRVAC